jgi:hypothetical protein
MVTRLANCAPGLLLLLPSVFAALASPVGVDTVIAGILAIPGVVVIVRGYRIGVTVTGDAVVIRNWFRSRTVERRSVLGLTYYPAVRWTSASGRKRWTPIMAFADFYSIQPLDFIMRHRQACVEQLMALLGPDPDMLRKVLLKQQRRKKRYYRGTGQRRRPHVTSTPHLPQSGTPNRP